jgi:hypothetical protein
MHYSQACSGFVGSETTEADTVCDSEEEESQGNGKNVFLFERCSLIFLDYNIKISCLLLVQETGRLFPTRVLAVHQQALPQFKKVRRFLLLLMSSCCCC